MAETTPSALLDLTLQSRSIAFFVPNPPKPPPAQPSSHLPPLGTDMSDRAAFCQCDKRAGERCPFCWAWEPSESQSLPRSAWSNATSRSALTSAPWTAGQRVLWASPERAHPASIVVVALKREVPQELWDTLELRLSSSETISLRPHGVRRGRRVAVSLPADLPLGDYDLSVHYGAAVLPGRLALEIIEKIAEYFYFVLRKDVNR
jgi:hypothetical protein